MERRRKNLKTLLLAHRATEYGSLSLGIILVSAILYQSTYLVVILKRMLENYNNILKTCTLGVSQTIYDVGSTTGSVFCSPR